jgi:hypothetical protein
MAGQREQYGQTVNFIFPKLFVDDIMAQLFYLAISIPYTTAGSLVCPQEPATCPCIDPRGV